MTACMVCPSGTYSQAGASECNACPMNAIEDDNITGCVCLNGYYEVQLDLALDIYQGSVLYPYMDVVRARLVNMHEHAHTHTPRRTHARFNLSFVWAGSRTDARGLCRTHTRAC